MFAQQRKQYVYVVEGDEASSKDCGGRSPTYDTSNVWRSLLITGGTTGASDGLSEDGITSKSAAGGRSP